MICIIATVSRSVTDAYTQTHRQHVNYSCTQTQGQTPTPTHRQHVEREGGAFVKEVLQPQQVVGEGRFDQRHHDAGEVDVGHHLFFCSGCSVV